MGITKRVWVVLASTMLLALQWSTAAAGQQCFDTRTLGIDAQAAPICDPEAGRGSSPPPANNLVIGTQCTLPGPHADDRCTVLYHVRDNPANNILCLWNDDALAACEGRTNWAAGFDFIPAGGANLEFRRHAQWPTLDPDWPNAARVRSKGMLLKQQRVTARHRSSPTGACDLVIAAGSSLAAAIATGKTTVCLGVGTHHVATALLPTGGQTIRSEHAANPATILVATGATGFDVRASDVTLKSLSIAGLPGARAQSAVAVNGAQNLLMDGVSLEHALVPLAIHAASNVELRDSRIASAGDGVACAGCAQPSLWISGSTDVRVVRSVLASNGVGPEGDGELACYNSPDLLVQNSTIADSGASGIYLVNCDRAVVIGNLIRNAREWGVDLTPADQASGSDFALFEWNHIESSRNGGAVLHDSLHATFTHNQYAYNRTGPGASGECNGVNRRGNTHGFWSRNDTATPWPVYCSE